jgi:hypothetical protein
LLVGEIKLGNGLEETLKKLAADGRVHAVENLDEQLEERVFAAGRPGGIGRLGHPGL